MKKGIKLRYMAYSLIVLFLSISIMSCEKDDDPLKSNLPVFVAGVLEINATYRLEGMTEFDVILTEYDADSIFVQYGQAVAIKYGLVSDTAITHVKISGDFVRFESMDYRETDRHEYIVLVSNLK